MKETLDNNKRCCMQCAILIPKQEDAVIRQVLVACSNPSCPCHKEETAEVFKKAKKLLDENPATPTDGFAYCDHHQEVHLISEAEANCFSNFKEEPNNWEGTTDIHRKTTTPKERLDNFMKAHDITPFSILDQDIRAQVNIEINIAIVDSKASYIERIKGLMRHYAESSDEAVVLRRVIKILEE